MTGSMNIRRLALTGVVAIVVGACSGGSAGSPAPTASAGATTPASQPAASSTAPASPTIAPSTAPTAEPTVEPSASQSAGGGDAIGALADLSSYKIKFVMSTKGKTGGVSAVGNMTMAGTVIMKPSKASDMKVSLAGSGTTMVVHAVEVNGKSYVGIGDMALTESTDPNQTSMADSLSPQKLLGGFSAYMSQLKTVGEEKKNGVTTTHLTADAATLAAASSGFSALGIEEAQWAWDVWVAKEGGYAVGYILKGTGKGSDGKAAELVFSLDVTDVNSPSNVVKAP